MCSLELHGTFLELFTGLWLGTSPRTASDPHFQVLISLCQREKGTEISGAEGKALWVISQSHLYLDTGK